MTNYFESIETEYSKIRGRHSMLSAIDVNLADQWEKKNVPLHIILRAMNDVHKKFIDQKRKDSINSLKYFAQEVEKQFAEWQTSQVGKYSAEEKPSEELSVLSSICEGDENSAVIENLISEFSHVAGFGNLPEPLQSAVNQTCAALTRLFEDMPLPIDDIETKLAKMAQYLQLSLIVSVSDEERAALIEQVNREYSKVTLNEESRAKILTKKLYQKFGLPELTLFEL